MTNAVQETQFSNSQRLALPVAPGSEAYTVGVVGFTDTERTLIGSIMGLTARREMRFLPFAPRPAAMPDIFLLDADHERCASYLKALAEKSPDLPVVLVGGHAHGTSHTFIPKPLRYLPVLMSFEEAIRSRHRPAQPESAEPQRIQSPVMQSQSAPPQSAPSQSTQPQSPSPQSAQPTAAAPLPAALARRRDRVLVVDDSLAVRKFMESKLAPFGFDVDYAENGEQAIGLTGEKTYTCVFLDVILPGIDGYKVCKLLKSKKGSAQKTAVVMLTSKSSPFDKIKGTMVGCNAYLTKPVDEERLLEVISKFLYAQTPESLSV
jgi:twitching motility two-component system response regulator PilG